MGFAAKQAIDALRRRNVATASTSSLRAKVRVLMPSALATNRNALKHGAFGAKAMAVREDIRALTRMTRKTLAAID